MLKSTYRTAAPDLAPSPLSTGWTEHKAPTGHTYYYNAETKQSTYTRPVAEPEELQIDFNATAPDRVVQASFQVLDEFNKNNPDAQRGQGQFTGGRSYQDRNRRDKRQDRPKSKKPITNCEPWVLVMTKFGRRFVHNTETKESLWKFPSEVMMAVIEMERIEWQAKQKSEEPKKAEERPQAQTEPAVNSVPNGETQHGDYDSDEYEEVEVTDDEDGADPSAKRQRTEFEEPNAPEGPVEFDEDDIAWQLAQMEEDELGAEEYDDDDMADDTDGLPMTAEDSLALFRSLLDEMQISPYSTFEALLEHNNAAIIDDPRWVSLPNMSSRREAFTDWSRDRVSELKAREAAIAATTKKQDPKASYLTFLQENATPKLYWPEFKRKFKKEPEMKDLNVSDKDREKLYREYITKIKTSDADRKKEFIALLKSVPKGEAWNRQTTLDNLPEVLERDLRFHAMRDKRTREDLIEAHLTTLGD